MVTGIDEVSSLAFGPVKSPPSSRVLARVVQNAGGTQLWQLTLVLATVAVTIQAKLHPAAMIVGALSGLALGR